MTTKNRSKLFIVALIAIFSLSVLLTGCLPDSGGSDADKETVKIAFIGPLTGANAGQGTGAKNAFELAIKQANESQKYDYNFEMLTLDDASNPSVAASAAKKAIADPQVLAGCGFWNSPAADAAIPIFKSANMPLMIWGAIGPALTSAENYPLVTRICPTMIQQTGPLAQFAVDQIGLKNWAVISDTTALGTGALAGWKEEMNARPDANLLSVDEIQVGTADFRPILTKIKQANPDGIFLGLVTMEAGLVTKQMHELGMDNVMIISLSGVVEDKYIEVASAAAAEGVVGCKPGKAIEALPGGQEFIDAYAAAGYAEMYGSYGPYAYDAANIIMEAIQSTGADKAKLPDAIAQSSYTGLLGTTSFSEIGQTTSIEITEMIVDEGKWVNYDTSSYVQGTKKMRGLK